MNFTEKLSRLAERIGKSKLARAAGLPPTAVSNYLFKGQTPRADNALALARAADVPVEWLIDEEQDWPPPKNIAASPQQFSDEELMREVCRRWRLEALRLSDDLDRLEKQDWTAFARAIAGIPLSKPVPDTLAATAAALRIVHTGAQRLARYEPAFAALLYAPELPGAAQAKELSASAILKRIERLWVLVGFEQAEAILSQRDIREPLTAAVEAKAERAIGEFLAELPTAKVKAARSNRSK